MPANPASTGVIGPQKAVTPSLVLTPKEAAKLLKVSASWLAKARMRGDGPPYIKVGGRSVRYTEVALIQWMCLRLGEFQMRRDKPSSEQSGPTTRYGRQIAYDREIFIAICRRFLLGEDLRTICAKPPMPRSCF
jgi:predicted DNA-binding transcriptional regulator AlpA